MEDRATSGRGGATRVRAGSRLIAGLALFCALAACSNGVQAAVKAKDPFIKETVEGSDLVRLRMEPKAVERMQLRTEEVGETITLGERAGQRALPYSALLYQPDGTTFVYTQVEENVFIRHLVTVSVIEGAIAYLTDGPEPGVDVVTDGAAELMGVEFGVGK